MDINIVRLAVVKKRTGLSRSAIYRKIPLDEFPSQIKLGKRSMGWLENDIDEWINKQVILSRA